MASLLQERFRLAASVGSCLLRHPEQAALMSRWVRDHRRAPLESRIPWWPYAAVAAVESALGASSRVFEFGGGGSTLWLEDHGATVTCVEHDPDWYAELRARTKAARVVLAEPTATGTIASVVPGFFDDYVGTVSGEDDNSLDLVVVDGRCRVQAAVASASKVRSGGLLLLDDSDRERYRPVFEFLEPWPSITYSGLKPGGLAQTTVWRRPS